MGVVPDAAEPESNAVARVIRGTEHRAGGDDNVLGQAGLEQRERIDAARQLGVAASERSGASMFWQGALSALTNPKALLFFAAFLPHFIDPARSLVTQFLVMAGTFALFECATELMIVGMAQRINAWLARAGKRFNQVCGGLFVAIGAALPLRG